MQLVQEEEQDGLHDGQACGQDRGEAVDEGPAEDGDEAVCRVSGVDVLEDVDPVGRCEDDTGLALLLVFFFFASSSSFCYHPSRVVYLTTIMPQSRRNMTC